MAQPANSRFVEVARFGRPHGLEGELKVLPNELFDISLIKENRIIRYLNKRGDLVPARVINLRVESKANQQTFFVKLDVIKNRNEADSFSGKALFVEKTEIPGSETENDVDIIDFVIQYKSEKIGRVTDLFENPAHAIIEANTEYGVLLIPWVDEFIDSIDTYKRILVCKNLNQFIDE